MGRSSKDRVLPPYCNPEDGQTACVEAGSSHAAISMPAHLRFDTHQTAGHNLRFPGGVPEWLKGADCKSVGLRLRWFESNLLHQNRLDIESTGAGGRISGGAVDGVELKTKGRKERSGNQNENRTQNARKTVGQGGRAGG